MTQSEEKQKIRTKFADKWKSRSNFRSQRRAATSPRTRIHCLLANGSLFHPQATRPILELSLNPARSQENRRRRPVQIPRTRGPFFFSDADACISHPNPKMVLAYNCHEKTNLSGRCVLGGVA